MFASSRRLARCNARHSRSVVWFIASPAHARKIGFALVNAVLALAPLLERSHRLALEAQ
jgi:hypothetical protein